MVEIVARPNRAVRHRKRSGLPARRRNSDGRPLFFRASQAEQHAEPGRGRGTEHCIGFFGFQRPTILQMSATPQMRSLVKFAIAIVVALLAAYYLYVRAWSRHMNDIANTNDVFAALLAYSHANSGHMPGSIDDLVRTGLVRKQPDGNLVVTSKAAEVHGKIYEQPICAIEKFEIRWGALLSDFTIRDGALWDSQGRSAWLFYSPLGPHDSTVFSIALLENSPGKGATTNQNPTP